MQQRELVQQCECERCSSASVSGAGSIAVQVCGECGSSASGRVAGCLCAAMLSCGDSLGLAAPEITVRSQPLALD